jgi:hypothetical protein
MMSTPGVSLMAEPDRAEDAGADRLAGHAVAALSFDHLRIEGQAKNRINSVMGEAR